MEANGYYGIYACTKASSHFHQSTKLVDTELINKYIKKKNKKEEKRKKLAMTKGKLFHPII